MRRSRTSDLPRNPEILLEGLLNKTKTLLPARFHIAPGTNPRIRMSQSLRAKITTDEPRLAQRMTTSFARELVTPIVCVMMFIHCFAQSSSSPARSSQQIQEAQALQSKGQLDEAFRRYESLREELQKQPPSSDLGFVLNEMSKIASGRGEYEPAVRLAQQSADTYRAIGDEKGQSHAINIKGLAEVDHGDYRSARHDFEQALALGRKVRDAENVVQVLNNLGSALYFEGKYLEALQSYNNAEHALSEISTEKWREYWRQVTDFNQATLFQRLGRYDKALEIYRGVEASSKTLTVGDRAHLNANLGTLYRRLGDPWKALEEYGKAQSLFARERDADGEIGVLKNIGIVYALDLHDLHKAQSIFNRALSLARVTKNRREEMQGHLYLAETYLQQSSAQLAKAEFETARQMAVDLGTTEEQWKALYGLGQCEERVGATKQAELHYRNAISLIETARVQLQLSSLRAEFLGDKRSVYDSLIALLISRNDAAEAFLFLERSRSRNFQDRLTSQAAASTPLTLQEVQSRLDASTVLLEYWTAEDHIAVIWCTRDNVQLIARDMPHTEMQALRAAIDKFPETTNGNDGDRKDQQKNEEQNWRKQSDVLRALLPASLLNTHSNIHHVIIVPDNWISTVPFDLLPVDSNQLLVERADLSYLPSAVLLRRPQPSVGRLRLPWSRELAAFGDPVVDSNGPGGLSDGQVQTLPFSAEEIHSIARLTPGRSELFLGIANQKSTFLSGAANSAPLLHVSTHAFADVSSPEDSRLLFSADGSSADRAHFVFLRELYDLDLSNVTMAVLSACDTERGKLVRGEGVQAFSRAFLAAGSRSTVTTLWRVDDRVTAQFMKHFYYFVLERRMPRSEALRQAKLKFLHSPAGYQNPRYWAAFSISGDALTPVPLVISWTALLAMAVLLLALLGTSLVWLGSRRRRHGQHNL